MLSRLGTARCSLLKEMEQRALAQPNVPSRIPHQPRSQEILGIGPSAASLCRERPQHE